MGRYFEQCIHQRYVSSSCCAFSRLQPALFSIFLDPLWPQSCVLNQRQFDYRICGQGFDSQVPCAGPSAPGQIIYSHWRAIRNIQRCTAQCLHFQRSLKSHGFGPGLHFSRLLFRAVAAAFDPFSVQHISTFAVRSCGHLELCNCFCRKSKRVGCKVGIHQSSCQRNLSWVRVFVRLLEITWIARRAAVRKLHSVVHSRRLVPAPRVWQCHVQHSTPGSARHHQHPGSQYHPPQLRD